MVIGSRPNLKKISTNLVEPPSFSIGGSEVEMVDKIKYLGMQIDKHLAWDEHTQFVRSKVSRAIGFLKYAKKLLPKDILCKMYRGIVEPYFCYCCSCKRRLYHMNESQREAKENALITILIHEKN